MAPKVNDQNFENSFCEWAHRLLHIKQSNNRPHCTTSENSTQLYPTKNKGLHRASKRYTMDLFHRKSAMFKPLENPVISLKLRAAVADAALDYANALIEGGINSHIAEMAHRELVALSDDMQTCLKADELNMEWGE